MNERRAQIQKEHALPKTRRCELLDVARSKAYYRPEPIHSRLWAEMPPLPTGFDWWNAQWTGHR